MIVTRLFIFTVCILTLGLIDASQAAKKESRQEFEVKSIKDIDYFTGEGYDKMKHKLDLYLPKGKKKFPVLFFVHGGGWHTGDRNYFGVYSSLAKFYARRGIGTVVPSYRLSPKVKHPEHIRDVARAFAWTYKNISKHGGNPNQIIISGHSAGGHLVALLATNHKYLKEQGLTSDAIKGVIPISGIFALPGTFLSSIFTKDAKVRKDAAPVHHVKKGLPPFLILFADRDFPGCGKLSAKALKKALLSKKVKATCLEIKNSNHIKILFSVSIRDSEESKAILSFIHELTKQ